MNIVKALAAKKIRIPLVMVGKRTNYAAKISEFISKNHLNNDIVSLDQVEDEYLPSLYQHAEMMVYLSKFEGFGLPVAEAMASGCPVLAANTSCLPETGGDAAIYCDPNNIEEIGNSIFKILDDPVLRETLAKKGKFRASELTPEKAASSLMKIYLQLFTP
jgi:glycosyltransferase involved in cell wall biosynthesis